MEQRFRVNTLASWQPRAYADSIRHVRLTIETFFAWLGNPKDPRSYWSPNDNWAEEIRNLLRLMKCGFTDSPPENWASTRLDWLKKISPGVWEFHTTSPYTD